jgi:hypothetical protein
MTSASLYDSAHPATGDACSRPPVHQHIMGTVRGLRLRGLTSGLAALAILLMFSPAVQAQSDSSIAVGVALTLYDPANPRADHPTGVGLVGRLRRGSGLGATVGLDWFKSNVQTEIGGQAAPLGTINIRPVMVGVSYIQQYHRYAISGGLVAGWAFNSLRQTEAERAVYRNRAALPDARLAVSNCFALRPDVTIWYELGNHFAASASVGYMVSRPTVTTSSALGQRAETVNLSATVITFGFVYGVF